MQIARFLDPDKQPRLGIDRGDGTAELLTGNSALDPGSPTGQSAPIARRLAPLEPANIFCIGLNYREHARETGASVPRYPVVFMKPTSALQHPDGPIRLPACQLEGPEVDYECELAVVIGRPGRDIPEDRALEHIAGYTAANDVSARRWQKRAGGGQWVRGKGFDTFCPLGPVLVTPDDIPDPQQLGLATHLNGQTLQQSNTSDMIFSVARIISFLSQDTTLQPGTVILTGTPQGVGFARPEPVFLKPGDEITIEIESIGKLTNPVVAAEDEAG